MLRTLAFVAAIVLAAGAASAQKIDANGRCHAANGQFAKADAGPYKLDAKGKCHDAKGKMAKKEMCKV